MLLDWGMDFGSEYVGRFQTLLEIIEDKIMFTELGLNLKVLKIKCLSTIWREDAALFSTKNFLKM